MGDLYRVGKGLAYNAIVADRTGDPKDPVLTTLPQQRGSRCGSYSPLEGTFRSLKRVKIKAGASGVVNGIPLASWNARENAMLAYCNGGDHQTSFHNGGYRKA